MAIFLLVVVLLTPDITSVGQGYSHCMADCNMRHGLSLYKQYCCQIGSNGKIVHLAGSGKKKIILCPSTQPKSCPGNVSSVVLVYHSLNVIVLSDCKSWYEAGYTISGIYLINPDGGTPFEVSCSTIIFIFHYMSLYRPIVTWRLMMVDGLSFKEEWMALLTSISNGLIMFMVLEIPQESIG